MADFDRLRAAIDGAYRRLAADYEAAAKAGDVMRRDRLGARLDALRQLGSDGETLALIAKHLGAL